MTFTTEEREKAIKDAIVENVCCLTCCKNNDNKENGKLECYEWCCDVDIDEVCYKWSYGQDCCHQDIVPKNNQYLSLHTNRHSADGTSWGWIEGCTLNICWSDNKYFNYKKASETVKRWNNNLSSGKK